jgi:hypothetical protein
MTTPGKTKYVPDYDNDCCDCGQSPTVTIFQDGLDEAQTELCGPCYFGEDDALNPDNW